MAKPPAYDDAKLHLQILGQEREITFPVRVGPTRVADLLVAAQGFSDNLTGAVMEHVRASGVETSCREGCAKCCRQLVPVSAIEAVGLSEVVAQMPKDKKLAVKRRFERAVARMEEIGILDKKAKKGRFALHSQGPQSKAWEDVSRRYFEAQIACPFLEDERCSIYAQRPLNCREYHVVSPAERCSELSNQVEATPRPVRMSEALMAAGNLVLDATLPSVPIALALEWAEVHGAPFTEERDGEEMFWQLAGCVEEGGG